MCTRAPLKTAQVFAPGEWCHLYYTHSEREQTTATVGVEAKCRLNCAKHLIHAAPKRYQRQWKERAAAFDCHLLEMGQWSSASGWSFITCLPASPVCRGLAGGRSCRPP